MDAPRKGLVDAMDWDRAADRVITAMKGLPPVEVARRTGIPVGTYRRWKRDRAKGETIGEPRGQPREALLRAVDEINGRKELLRGKGEEPVSESGEGDVAMGGDAAKIYRDLSERIERTFAEVSRPPEEREAWVRANEIAEPILRIAEREAIAATVRAEALRAAARAMERGEMASAARAQLAGGGQAGVLPMEETMRRVVAQVLKEQGGAAGGTGTHGPNHP